MKYIKGLEATLEKCIDVLKSGESRRPSVRFEEALREFNKELIKLISDNNLKSPKDIDEFMDTHPDVARRFSKIIGGGK